jgi:hypothetical protein
MAVDLFAKYDNTLLPIASADCPVCGIYGYALQ